MSRAKSPPANSPSEGRGTDVSQSDMSTDPGAISSERTTVYEQDGESYRYIDQKKWSRFQTASAIEGAVLYGAFQIPGLVQGERFFLVLFGTLIILLIFAVVVLEERDARGFLTRIRSYEKAAKTPFSDRSRPRLLGRTLTAAIMALIVAFNIVVMTRILVGHDIAASIPTSLVGAS